MVAALTNGLPPWKTAGEIIRRVTELKVVPAPGDYGTPFPLGGRQFMAFPQTVRFRIYELLLSSSEPVIRPWASRKFTMQLLRLNCDIFAEAAYVFYGKGDQGLELEDEVDLLSTHDQDREVYMGGVPPCRINKFQMMMNHATGHFNLPPEPYLSLINHINLSPSTRWTPATILDYLAAIPNLTNLTIQVHSLNSIFPKFREATLQDCEEDILCENRYNNRNFIRDTIYFLNHNDANADGKQKMVEVDIEQHILQPRDPINVANAALEDWHELPDKLRALVWWDADVKLARKGGAELELTNRGHKMFEDDD